MLRLKVIPLELIASKFQKSQRKFLSPSYQHPRLIFYRLGSCSKVWILRRNKKRYPALPEGSLLSSMEATLLWHPDSKREKEKPTAIWLNSQNTAKAPPPRERPNFCLHPRVEEPNQCTQSTADGPGGGWSKQLVWASQGIRLLQRNLKRGPQPPRKGKWRVLWKFEPKQDDINRATVWTTHQASTTIKLKWRVQYITFAKFPFHFFFFKQQREGRKSYWRKFDSETESEKEQRWGVGRRNKHYVLREFDAPSEQLLESKAHSPSACHSFKVPSPPTPVSLSSRSRD